MNQAGVTMMAMVNSVNLTSDPEHNRILKKAWDAKLKRLLQIQSLKPGFGKDYSTVMYGTAEAASLCSKDTN